MCGIVGHVNTIWTPEESACVLNRQMQRIRHRGPDGGEVYTGQGVGLGHVRLAVIDPMGGAQPMVCPDTGMAVTFNGEIYNYQELREQLRAKGHAFRTSSDTEVLLRGFAQWDESLAQKLNGMFAFAIYDPKTRRLYCARDHFGQKPFYYVTVSNSFHFASESRCFLEIDGFTAHLSVTGLAHYLCFEGLPGALSIYEEVHKLEPGRYLVVENSGIRIHRYFTACQEPSTLRGKAAVEAVDHAIGHAVDVAYRAADVPVGVLLSGGLDSTLVLARLRSLHPTTALRSFTVKLEDPTYDESEYARRAAALFSTEHHECHLDLEMMAALARDLPAMLDEPAADPGMLPMYAVCGQVRRMCKVALSGVGGDELFYGYITFKAQRIAQVYRNLPNWYHTCVARPLAMQIPVGKGYMSIGLQARHFTKGFPGDDALRNLRWTCSFDAEVIKDLFKPEVREQADVNFGQTFLREAWAEARQSGFLGRLANQYQRGYLPDYVLVNADRSSMLQSVELRAPLLDPQLATLVNGLADREKMPGLLTKALLKKIALRYLPCDVVNRKKMGFTVPVAELLRTKLREELIDLLSPDALRRDSLLMPGVAQRLLKEHLSSKANHYKPLWTLYVYRKWQDAQEKKA